MQLINKYFPNLSESQKENFLLLGELYNYWNKRINLISRKDIDNLYERHILYSLAIAKFIHFNVDSQILDVGTGGGFPGIPLAIIFEKCKFHLVDSIQKKIKVVDNIIDKCGLKNTTTQACRVEQIFKKYDYIVSRAVSNMPTLIKLCKKNVSTNHKHSINNGIICLKGGDVSKEFKEEKYSVHLINCSDFFKEDFFKTKKIAHIFF